jgi:hypothetical protein
MLRLGPHPLIAHPLDHRKLRRLSLRPFRSPAKTILCWLKRLTRVSQCNRSNTYSLTDNLNCREALVSLPVFGSLPSQPADVVQGFIEHNVRRSPVSRDKNTNSPPSPPKPLNDANQAKPAPAFFGSIPTQAVPGDRSSVGERLLRLHTLMAQRNAALDQPLSDQPSQPCVFTKL